MTESPNTQSGGPAGSCRACAAPLEPTQRYCLNCGARLRAPRVEAGPVLAALATASLAADYEGSLPPVEALSEPPVGDPDPGAGAAGAAAGGPMTLAAAFASRPVAAAGLGLLMLGAILGSAFGPPSADTLAAQRKVIIVQAAGAPAVGPAADPVVADPGTTPAPLPAAPLAPAAPLPAAPTDPGVTDPGPGPDVVVPPTDPSLKHLVVVMLPGGVAGQSLVAASTAKVARPRATAASVDYKTAFDGIRKQGFLLKGFRQVSASGVANRIALLSGITPTAAMEAGCTGPLALASAADGCVVPPSSSADATDLINLVSPLSGTVDGGTRAYVETPEDDAYTDLCSPLEIGKPAPVWSDGTPPAQDNPLQWFQGITKTLPSAGSWDPSRSALCFVKGSHEGSTRPISMLGADLTKAASEDAAQIDPSLPSAFPMVTLIIPSRCRTDATLTCPDGKTHGGPEALKSFLDKTIGTTLAGSTIFKKDGAAFVMWDKAPKAARHGHKAAISTQPAVGALVLSPFTKAGGSNTTAYDTYGLLLTLETRLGLVGAIGQPTPLGGSDGANPMGREVFPAR